MDQAKVVETKARDVAVVNEVSALLFGIVVRLVVTTDRQYFSGALLNRDDVWQRDVVWVFVPFEVKIDLHLKQLVAVVRSRTEAHLLSDLLLYIVERIDRITQINITIEATYHEFL